MEKLAVFGTGTMGHSIALNAAWMGVEVNLYGLNAQEIRVCVSGIDKKVDILVQNNLIQIEEKQTILNRITTFTSVEGAVSGATFVIEAIPENLKIKQSFFKELDSICNKDVILASNTSGLSPTKIASLTENPQRVIVTHFWNPAHLIPLVEVVRGKDTDKSTVIRSMNFLELLKKKPIEVKKDVLGFVGNRLQYALLREAQYLLEEGVASLEDIDKAVTYSIGRRLPVTGPFMTADMGGLDVFRSISNYLYDDLSKAESSYQSIENLVENKQYGQKSGEGYYQWDNKLSEEMEEERQKVLIEFLRKDFEQKDNE